MNLSTLLISANVGSLFDDAENLFSTWLECFYKTVKEKDSDFIAIHCQEVGGKNFEESMPNVKKWVMTLLESTEMSLYSRVKVFLDEDFKTAETFTALGCLYFVHNRVKKICIWNFVEKYFEEVCGQQVFSGKIEDVAQKEKSKFPLEYFPDGKWSRKGFIRTRWQVNDLVFDLADIHLFHDASNLDCLQVAPSTYSQFREKALRWTLNRFANDGLVSAPLFIFGDFNFRLNLPAYVNKVAGGCQRVERPKEGVDFVNCEGTVLTVGKKLFDRFQCHDEFYENANLWLNEFDFEREAFDDLLFEFPITFSPTYPFSEEHGVAKSFMKTRIPSWCDRVLLSHRCRSCILCPESSAPSYGILGADSCMGDHKPVYLHVHLSTAAHNNSTSLLNRLHELPGVQVKVTEKAEGSYVQVRRDGQTVCSYRDTAE